MPQLVLPSGTSDLFGNSPFNTPLMCDVASHPKLRHMLRAVGPSVVLASGTWHHLTYCCMKPNCATVSRSGACTAALSLREHGPVVAI
jgi:hypothetical protein